MSKKCDGSGEVIQATGLKNQEMTLKCQGGCIQIIKVKIKKLTLQAFID